MTSNGSTAKNARMVRAKPSDRQGALSLANHEVVVLAAYLAGAQGSPADTEDIAIRANQLAPGRFTWRKYADQINIDTVRKRLWDAAKVEKGGYLIGSEKDGWRLTQAGFDFAEKHLRNFHPTQHRRQRSSKNERATWAREIRRLIQEDAFVKFTNGSKEEITQSEVEHFFRVDDYVTGNSRRAKIERFKIIARDHPSLSEAIGFLTPLIGNRLFTLPKFRKRLKRGC